MKLDNWTDGNNFPKTQYKNAPKPLSIKWTPWNQMIISEWDKFGYAE